MPARVLTPAFATRGGDGPLPITFLPNRPPPRRINLIDCNICPDAPPPVWRARGWSTRLLQTLRRYDPVRWSNALIPTLKETPADAVAPSHVLLLRAGMIRQLGAGAYTYLPLGLRVLQKAVQIVREEMDAAGAHRAAHAGACSRSSSGRSRPVRDLRRPADEADHQRRPPDVPRADPRGGHHRPGPRPRSTRTSSCRSRFTRSRPSSATSPGRGSASSGPASS